MPDTQGFMAATSMKLQGSVILPVPREIETWPASSGWRMTLSAERLNSGSSSRNSPSHECLLHRLKSVTDSAL